jgi:hypothetical protein
MHIPSARVYQEMRSEVASLWFVPTVGDGDVALLLKSTSASIKALVAGCTMNLVFGSYNDFLCAGARIHDIPEHPLFVCGVELHKEDIPAINRAIDLRNFPVFLFNELDVCVAWSNAAISEADAQAIKTTISKSAFYVGPFNEAASYALDCLCYSTDRTQQANGATIIDFTEIPIAFEKWHANHISFVGMNDKHTVRINDLNEGAVLERATWASLESVFPLTLQMSPQIKVGEKTRELTDVLAHHEYGSFFIEAKDLSIFQSGFHREQARRTKGAQKQAIKAITQLIGASKAAKRGDPITGKDGKPLSINLTNPIHCIVLLTELMHDGDWQEVEQQLRLAMVETGDFFHVLDLQELITILKCSKGDPALFDYNLMERCKHFAKSGTIHMRSRLAPQQVNKGNGTSNDAAS